MTLYELMNNTTIFGDVFINIFDADGRSIDGFFVKKTDNLADSCAGGDWNEAWEYSKVKYIYVNINGVLVIEIQEEE